MQRKAIVYDGTGDEHYDAASALIKSMRGSDPDAAVYWVARMLQAGEDPRFIARRIAILASEDIGNADPRALQIGAAAYDVVEKIGMPECQLTLGQAAIYMACAPKSNASAKAIWSAMSDVKEGRTIPVPRHLRDGHYKGSKRTRPRQRLPVPPRRPRRTRRARLPRRRPHVLRAHRPRVRAGHGRPLESVARQGRPGRDADRAVVAATASDSFLNSQAKEQIAISLRIPGKPETR